MNSFGITGNNILDGMILSVFIGLSNQIVRVVLDGIGFVCKGISTYVSQKYSKKISVEISSGKSEDPKNKSDNEFLIKAIMHNSILSKSMGASFSIDYELVTNNANLPRTVIGCQSNKKIKTAVHNFSETEMNISYNVTKKDNENGNKSDNLVHVKKVIITTKLGIVDVENYIERKRDEYLSYITKVENSDLKLKLYKHTEFRSCYTYRSSIMNFTKNFNSLFIDDKHEILDKLDKFKNNNTDNNKLTILLHGKPGCGKTTLVQLIAKYLERHIFLLNIGILGQEHIEHAFFYDQVYDYFDSTLISVPKNKRIIVIEEIDTQLDNLDRFDKKGGSDSEDALNKKTERLGFLLNLLQGFPPLKDIVVIITTNYPEKLDKALLRPGRIDWTLELKLMNNKNIRRAICYYYKTYLKSLSDNKRKEHHKIIGRLADLYNNIISPAVLENICTNNPLDNVEDKIEEWFKYDKGLDDKKNKIVDVNDYDDSD